MTVRPGDNITLYCDCNSSTGVYILWYRNCSHENQPSLVLNRIARRKKNYSQNPLPRFHFVKSSSSESYDLLIINITETDEGLYYCGTETFKVEKNEQITSAHIYTHGNISTRIHVTVAALSSLLSSLLVYHLCKKEAKEPQTDQQTAQTRLNQDEDVCYAALEIRPASKRPKRTTTQSSDFSTYSAINTSRILLQLPPGWSTCMCHPTSHADRLKLQTSGLLKVLVE
ncbi:uncharacterized protein [Pseudochaenichthys georgianus]|uniref:uncharacterized protein n=1 Tax=Pseudochaenichthys georgianus TaxID=52239 RepID=UPI0039C1A0E9